MIRLADDIRVLKSLCVNSPFGCPIISAAEAYGLDKMFAQFWTDEQAAYSKLDGVMRICGTLVDPEETAVFIRAVGAEQVVCELSAAEALGLHITERGAVLYKDVSVKNTLQAEEVSVRTVYDVLHACEMVGAFEPFYLDVSHRVRHGTAHCTAICSGEETVAAAVSVYGADCALITAVGVRPEYRRKGFGTQIMHKTECALSGKVYLFRAENENEHFYDSLGYLPCGTWCSGTLQ